MKNYLIRFVYDQYCPGYDDATETVLVYSDSFWNACNRIRLQYKYAGDFINLTIE